MSRFSGPQHAGALRDHRTRLRTQAATRNALTAPENRREHREGPPRTRYTAAPRRPG